MITSKKNPSFLIPGLLIGGVLLILLFYFGTFYFTKLNVKPIPPPANPEVQTIPGWKTFTEPRLGVSFQYPPAGKEYFGTNFSNQQALAPEAQIDLNMNCQNKVPSIFAITRSNIPPNAGIKSKLTQKIQVNGIDADASADPESGNLQISLQKGTYYYYIKFITCDATVNQQILSTFQFIN